MEKPEEYISYKKLLIFGSEDSGKTSLTNSIEKEDESDESKSKEGKI